MILVFGGTGFVGRNLVPMLREQGRNVRVVSRRPDGAFLDAHAPGTEHLTLEQFYADPAAALFGCTSVIYLASTSTPGANLTTPWQEAQDTLDPVLRVMSNLVEFGSNDGQMPHFVYLSSGGTVYGQVDQNMIHEDTPLNPISPYGLGKKMSEIAVDFMARTRGLRATILRPANPIGQWQTSLSQGVVGALCRAATQGASFPMLGDGSAVRDYFDVRDLARAIIMTLDAPDASVGQIWNVGSGCGNSVREIHALVQDVSGRDIAIETRPSRPTDVDRVVLDIGQINAALNWHPSHELRDTLRGIWAGFEPV